MLNLRKAIAATALSLVFALPASAALMTITLDNGYYDPTISDPTGEFHGPYDWIEGDARVAGFWARNVGTAAGEFVQGHTHLQENVASPSGPGGYVAEYTHAYTNDLQGLLISLESGATFDLVSINYDVAATEILEDPLLQRLGWSFAASNPHFVASPTFDPTATDFEAEFQTFAALEDGNPGTYDWHTLSFAGSGLTGLTQVYLAQTAALTWIDSIVIDIDTSAVIVPEPSTALLLGFGLAAFSARKRRA